MSLLCPFSVHNPTKFGYFLRGKLFFSCSRLSDKVQAKYFFCISRPKFSMSKLFSVEQLSAGWFGVKKSSSICEKGGGICIFGFHLFSLWEKLGVASRGPRPPQKFSLPPSFFENFY